MSAENFFEAVVAGDLDAVREALAESPDLTQARMVQEQTDEEGSGWTPLHLAAYHGHAEVALAIVDAGANVNAQMKYELTPLDLALRCDASHRMEQRNRRLEGKDPLPDRDFKGVIELLRARGGQELSGPQDI